MNARLTLFSTLMCILIYSANCQWVEPSNISYVYTTDRVGVGLNGAPVNRLHIYENQTIGIPNDLTKASIYIDNGGVQLGIDGNQIATSMELNLHAGPSKDIILFTDNLERIRLKGTNGRLGIGTTTPASLLHVSTKVSGTGDAILRLEADTENDNANEGNNARIEMYQDGGIISAKVGFNEDINTNANIFQIGAGVNATFHQFALTVDPYTGFVGVGIMNPDEQLTVNGTIRSKEVKVEASPWPDYVFDESYDLRSLAETEQYIKDNKHLPNIPSVAEVSENGIELGEMNAKLLEKIEELTLHQIKQQHMIDLLLEKLEQQQQMITDMNK